MKLRALEYFGCDVEFALLLESRIMTALLCTSQLSVTQVGLKAMMASGDIWTNSGENVNVVYLKKVSLFVLVNLNGQANFCAELSASK